MNASEARMFATQKLQEWNLEGWRFVIDQRPKRRGGQCRYGPKEVALSAWMLQDGAKQDEATRDTILHEIAHALTPGAKHGPRWRAMALLVGANPERTFNAEDNGLERPAFRYQAKCAGCDRTHGFHRKTKRNYLCKCGHPDTLKFARVL